MDSNFKNSFTFNFKEIIIDEIALEGLEGIGIRFLWKRVENKISSPVTDKMKIRFWKFIVKFNNVTFYQNPEPMPNIEILDRFSIVHEETGQLLDPVDYLDGPYNYAPVGNNGSSVHYNQRIVIEKEELQGLSYNDVITKYGDHLTIVASKEERWKALAGHVPISYLSQLTTAHYCVLEIVGKARDNGQMTVGNTNLTKIMKDPKHLFYIRKHLQDMGLVRTQCHPQFVQGRGMKSILLRLKRFHKPILLSTPKVGKLHNIIEYLKKKPDHSEKVDLLIKTGYLNHKQSKRLQKTLNVFRFEERQIKVDEISNNRRQKVFVKKKYISLEMSSEESDNSEDETPTAPLECQYKVGISLLRQAYERFLDAGLKGLTQIQLAQILGVEFYTSRTICRTLKSKNIVKEFLEDKGRQRTARYIAVAATTEIDNIYEEEKKKFLHFMNTSNIEDIKEEVPAKKMRVEEDEPHENVEASDNVDTDITEVKVIEGLENMINESLLNSKKNPTLRQLKFANGLLKVVRERRAISGYHTLSTLVSKDIGEPPMDTKALKSFVQKLVKDGQVKMYKIKWPGFHQKYTTLVCDPLMKSNDPVIIGKYKEISMKALTSQKSKVKRALTEGVTRPLSQFAYPRYMKMQKLHELVINVVYFSDIKSQFPEGFACVLSVVPHMTIGFAVGNISNVAISDIAHMRISDNLLDIKLKDAPSDLYERLLQSKSLQNSIRSNLKALAMMGLIQLISEAVPLPSTDYEGNLLSYLFYVNRRAKILDTSGIWPKPNTDLGKLEKSYHFKTFEDVSTYWNDVYNISTSTNVEIVIKRDRKKIKPPVRKAEDVQLYDNGERYGDGLGPCAFDSSFFMDIPRLWRTFYIRAAKMTQPPLRRKKKGKKIKIETVKKPKMRPVIKKKPLKAVINELTINRRKRRQPDSLIKWSKWEDKIIMLCKAAITIMSPTSHPDCLRVRNAVAKEILYMADDKKTATACHRRAAAIECNSILMHEKECILNEVRRRPDLIQKYEGLLKRLRIRYSANLSRLFKECKIPMLELVRAMCLISRSKSFTQRVPCVAVDLEDFNKKFDITSSSSSSAVKTFNMYRTPVDCDRLLASLKEGIIMTTMLSFENTINSDVASKVYAIFKKHPEVLLRTALEQLRKSGAISARDKILNNHLHRVEIEDIVQSSYKISAFYQRRWICRLNSDFIDILGDSLEKQVPVDGVKGSPEINCIFCELLACDIFDLISLTTPAISGYSGSIMQEEQLNVIDIENKYSLKSGLVGCKLKCNIKEFSDLYEDIDIDGCMQEIQSFNVLDHTDIVELSEDEIVDHLEQIGDKGCTFQELKAHFSYDTKTLCKKLNDLEMKKIITRVGYYENKIILTEHFKSWALTVEVDKSFIPVPWLSLDYEVRFDILFKWAGVIVNKVFESPGCSVSVLSDSCEVLSYRAVQDICMFLKKCECVILHCVEIPEPALFSDNLPPNELMEFNRWDTPDNIVVFPTKNILTKYAYVRKNILEKWL
ncbi:PREDICTED: uncharacterized protein LOC106102464 [Papilio polytes]|uniref:uncharacterized protein LOC106102464 n=1 Tax=Papilio polytes TaxID=76194 RepID=UPI00067615A7|nr:PREDICTED: uncharacterized protein LOC106102464 [Papilio polytes]